MKARGALTGVKPRSSLTSGDLVLRIKTPAVSRPFLVPDRCDMRGVDRGRRGAGLGRRWRRPVHGPVGESETGHVRYQRSHFELHSPNTAPPKSVAGRRAVLAGMAFGISRVRSSKA